MLESPASTARSHNSLDSAETNSSTLTKSRRSMPILPRRSRSRAEKKQRSLYLNQADFELCPAPDENEALDLMNSSALSQQTNVSESNQSDGTISDQGQYSASRTNGHRHDILAHIKHRLKPHRSEPSRRDHERNEGFVLVERVNSDLVFVGNDHGDFQATRHAETCAHIDIDGDSIDAQAIQYTSLTPMTPNLLPPTESSITTELDIQATQAGVECAGVVNEQTSVQDTELSVTDQSSSPTSTNSSNTTDEQLTNVDRSALNDIEYLQAQKQDLERITIFEIGLSNDRRDYQQSLADYDEPDITVSYKNAEELNIKLKKELQRLNDERARIFSPWSCEVCTYTNEPYNVTGRDVCEMCEGPSPLKRHTLTS